MFNFGRKHRRRSRKGSRKSRKGSRKSRKGSRKSRKRSRKTRKGSRKTRKGSNKKGRKGRRSSPSELQKFYSVLKRNRLPLLIAGVGTGMAINRYRKGSWF